MTLTDERLAEIEAQAREALDRAEMATAGPWEPCLDSHSDDRWVESLDEDVCEGPGAVADMVSPSVEQRWADAKFVAAARTDVPALASVALEWAEEIRRLRRVVDAADYLVELLNLDSAPEGSAERELHEAIEAAKVG